MKKKMIILVLILTLTVAGLVSVSYAASEWTNPAELLASLTGSELEEVQAEREAGTTYGAQAIEAGVQEEFQAGKLEIMQDRLDQAVADGRITQEDADARLDQIEANLAECDGSGNGGTKMGGLRMGDGSGAGQGRRGGFGGGSGAGSGACNGTCRAQ